MSEILITICFILVCVVLGIQWYWNVCQQRINKAQQTYNSMISKAIQQQDKVNQLLYKEVRAKKAKNKGGKLK